MIEKNSLKSIQPERAQSVALVLADGFARAPVNGVLGRSFNSIFEVDHCKARSDFYEQSDKTDKQGLGHFLHYRRYRYSACSDLFIGGFL